MIEVLDAAIATRLPRLEVDPEARTLAVPLSDKQPPRAGWASSRAARACRSAGTCGFFIYWKQHARVTDYDLSVQLLDEDFMLAGQVSYTNLSSAGAVHSGDITEAPDGASEFIDVDLSAVKARYVVPTVNVFSGEGFDDGRARRSSATWSAPPSSRAGRSSRARCAPSPTSRPRAGDAAAASSTSAAEALWLHLNLRGYPNFNRVEEHHRCDVAARARDRRAHATSRSAGSRSSPRSHPGPVDGGSGWRRRCGWRSC